MLEREKEAEKRVHDIQMQVEMMKLISESHKTKAPSTAPLGNGPQVKLVPLTTQDDIKSYLVTFERIMEVPKEQWTYYLPPQLTGKAQQVFAALSLDESKTYDGVKTAVLMRYGVNEEAYR